MYSYGDTTISFKRTTNKEISRLSEKTAIVIQALKALGREYMTDETKARVRSAMTAEEREALLSEAKYATARIYEIIKEICR